MNEIKPLSERETELKEEMKSRCLNKGLYIDENAQEKFKMLCHLEDFEVKYHELEHNWNELKKWLEEEKQEYRKDSYSGEYGWIIGTMVRVLFKMQELEEGGNNEY